MTVVELRGDAAECYADNHQDELKLKPRDHWRYIGKDAQITDLDDMVTGKAIYGIDVKTSISHIWCKYKLSVQ